MDYEIKVNIYVLIDPTTSKIRYIGRTSNELQVRLNGHVSTSKHKKTHKDCWINSLIILGYKPKIKLIKIVYGWEYSYEIEKELIKKAIAFGFDLTNTDDRGIGLLQKIITEEQRIKISKTLKEGYKTGQIKNQNTTPVSVFDLNGNFIQSFISCADCCRCLKIPQSSIEKVLSGYVKRWKNYQITYGENPGKYQKRTNYSFNDKPVKVFNIETMKVLIFKRYKDAAKYFNISTSTIKRYIKSSKKYKNKYLIKNN